MERAYNPVNGFTYNVEKKIGVISEHSGTSKELNLISFNGAPARYDLRTWKRAPGETPKMYKGITLTEEEARLLYNLLSKELEI